MGYGFARWFMRYFHPNFGEGSSSSLAHDHPLGEGGGVFPTSTVTTNVGLSGLLMWKPADNGGWEAETHLAPSTPGAAQPLTVVALSQGYTVRVDGDKIQIFDSGNTLTVELP